MGIVNPFNYFICLLWRYHINLKNLIENMIDENKKSAFDVLEQHSVSSVIVDFFKGLL